VRGASSTNRSASGRPGRHEALVDLADAHLAERRPEVARPDVDEPDAPRAELAAVGVALEVVEVGEAGAVDPVDARLVGAREAAGEREGDPVRS
jgi:hypothetical protein